MILDDEQVELMLTKKEHDTPDKSLAPTKTVYSFKICLFLTIQHSYVIILSLEISIQFLESIKKYLSHKDSKNFCHNFGVTH